jgi:hypothetical protein
VGKIGRFSIFTINSAGYSPIESNCLLSLIYSHVSSMNPLRLLLAVLLIAVFSLGGVEAKTPNPYRVLGVRKEATEDEIRKAFKKRSLKFHPDRSQDPRAKEKFEMVVNAY